MIVPRRVLIVPNPRKPDAKRLAVEVRRLVERAGISVAGGAAGADLLIIVGGDGTLLYNKGMYSLPIFAIGSKRSFICQATRENWRAKLGKVLRGFTVERRMMLACIVRGKAVEHALNEVVIRSRDHRVIDIHVRIGGRQSEFYADGILFSTPTGSSAYCYSCGGRELPRHARRYEIVAIAPYRRRFKPVVVPDSAACAAWTMSRSADLVFDGQFIHHMAPGTRMAIRRSKRTVELVRA